jgi:hypothetical protein
MTRPREQDRRQPRADLGPARLRLQRAARLAVTSIVESRPKPARAMLPAAMPAPIAITPSVTFPPIVTCWRSRPVLAIGTRAAAAVSRGMSNVLTPARPALAVGGDRAGYRT